MLRLARDWQAEHPAWFENEDESLVYAQLVQHVSAPVDLECFRIALCKKVQPSKI
jgi:hypothetical protein